MRAFRNSLIIALALVGVSSASAQDHPWLIRGRAVVIAPNAKSAPAGLDVKSDATMEIDISRSLSKFLSAELILATAGHEVMNGTASLGAANILPPTLLLQIHPDVESFKPYLGVGGNMTYFYGKSGGLNALTLTTSFGWALQGGFDVPIGTRGVFNVDAKYIKVSTDVKSGSTKAYTLDINPLVIGVGFGYRF